MASTLAEKIIARAADREMVGAGEMVTASVDLLMAHDSSGPRNWRPRLETLNAKLWDSDKVVIVSDHFAPATNIEAASILKLTRQFARDFNVKHFFDMEGICHTLLPERGLLRPGMFVAGGDSHTTMAGAYACYAAGFGGTDTTAIAATGETWLTVPETIRVELVGDLVAPTTAKDIMLWLCRRLGMNNSFKAIEYTGSAVSKMDMGERTVLSNMAAELGAETGLIGVDATTIDTLQKVGVDTSDSADWVADEGARYEKSVTIDVTQLGPQIAAPHSPANSDTADAFKGVAIDQCYIGACVGAKIEDLRMAAQVLKDRSVAKHTQLLVAPSSNLVTTTAAAEGIMEILVNAGAIILPSGCGACAGFGMGVLAEGDVCLSTTNRNFKGRMGHPESKVYLGSAYSVTAGAVAGEIIDPRELL